MMVRNKMNRIKAVVVGMAMAATTLVTPVMTSMTSVTAAVAEVASLPHTFTADGVEDGPRQGNVALPRGTKAGDTVTLSFTTSSTVNASIGVYGFGTDSKEDGYWYSIPKADEKTYTYSSGGKSTFTCQVVIPSAMAGNPTKIGVGVWYPEDDSEWTLKSITKGSSSGTTDPTDPAEPTIPETENNKSGTCDLIDNKDGTATIIATLSAQYNEPGADGESSTQFDALLTKGTDEECYAPYKDADGNELPAWKEGDPINSKKFLFTNFGIDDMSNIKFQSFEYVIASDDYDMSTIQYGGGINVEPKSPADTEYVKDKNGYWYNDQGAEDMEAYDFLIDDVHGGYEATGCGGYAKLTWDVPKSVQEYVDLSNALAAVGFQYWWGKDDTQTSTNEEGDELNYKEIDAIHLKSCTATYTREVIVPYNTTVQGPTNVKLTSGSDTTNQAKFSLAELELGERDRLSAVEFTFKSAEALAQFVGACGISVDDSKVGSAAGVKEGWYQSSNIAVINTDGNFKVMWVIPDAIREGIYTGTADSDSIGEVLIGYWYGDVEGGTEVKDITVSDVKYHIYRSVEEDIELKGEDGLTIPEEIELKVGETYEIKSNVENTTYESDKPAVVTVDENGVLTGVAAGTANITVKTPEGQEAKIKVTVVEAVTTPAVTTTAKTTTTAPTTTTTPSTTVDPSKVIDWTSVLYGDVNLDREVNLADSVTLSKYIASKEINPLLNATAEENANVEYDTEVDSTDASKLVEYNVKSIGILDLGPADKSKCPLYVELELL